MIPSVEQVMNRRSIVRITFRATALLMLVIGLIPLLWELCDDTVEGDLLQYLPHYLSRNSDEVSWLIVNLAIAAALWLMQGRFARWLVPWPERRCPQCDYRLVRLASPRCPECGCDLPSSFVSAERREPPAGS